MLLRQYFIKKGIIKRILLVLTALMLITALSAMTFYSAGSTGRIIPSDNCDGGNCCLSIDCSCTNCDNGEMTAQADNIHYDVVIEDEPIPLFSSNGRDFFLFAPMGVPSWAIFNLILTVTGVVLSLITVLRALRQKKEEFSEIDRQAAKFMEDDSIMTEEVIGFIENENLYTSRRRLIALVIKYVLSFAAALLLILTQNFKGVVAVFDFWSAVHAIMFTGIIISGRLVFKKHRKGSVLHV